ncbi:MAG: MFS transporter [Clostridiales bacterium]|nr:MFS transporter [Clostridiales bacterium]
MVKKLPLSGKILYAASSAGWAMIDRVVITWLFFYYVTATDSRGVLMQSAVFGSIMVFGRIVDAIADPLIALWSDNFRGRLGRRMPFLLAGGFLYVLVFIALFYPPVAAESKWNVLYLLLMMGTYFFLFTVYVCPYLALMPELAQTKNDRVDLATLKAGFTLLGVAVALVGSGILIGMFGFKGMVWGLGLTGLVFMYLPTLIKEKDYARAEPASLGLIEAVTTTFKNRAFRIFLAGNVTFWFGFNIITLGLPFYVTVLLGLEKEQTSLFFAATFGVAVLMFPLINFLAKRVGLKIISVTALFLFAAIFPWFYLLGQPVLGLSPVNFAFLIMALTGIPLSSLFVVPDAMVSSITDLEETLSGQRREAMYFGTQGLILKIAMGLSTFITGMLLQFFGSTAADSLGVQLTGVIAAVFCLVGGFIFLHYPEKEVMAYSAEKAAGF